MADWHTMTAEGVDGPSNIQYPTSEIHWHRPVMVEEVLRALHPRPGAVIVDGTTGTGGHSLALLPHLLPDGIVIAADRDRSSLDLAQQRLAEFAPQVHFIHANYRDLPHALLQRGHALVDGILLDLGMSSAQVDQAERGFSFNREGPLDMRMDCEQSLTAASLVNTLSADELAMLLRAFGEERFAARIARAVTRARGEQRIATTAQLARLVAHAVPPAARHGRLHPATRTFQALRIAVNDELGALEEFLAHAPEVLKPQGRLAILTYHSLEDRAVKQAFAQGAREGLWMLLTKKPVCPAEAEIAGNPRARSAKLRAVERT